MLQLCIHGAHNILQKSVLPFSGLVDSPIPQMDAKFAERYVCWAGSWPKQTQYGCESRGPRTTPLTYLSGRKRVSRKINIHV